MNAWLWTGFHSKPEARKGRKRGSGNQSAKRSFEEFEWWAQENEWDVLQEEIERGNT